LGELACTVLLGTYRDNQRAPHSSAEHTTRSARGSAHLESTTGATGEGAWARPGVTRCLYRADIIFSMQAVKQTTFLAPRSIANSTSMSSHCLIAHFTKCH